MFHLLRVPSCPWWLSEFASLDFKLNSSPGNQLVLFVYSPERTDPKPSECECECHRCRNMPSVRLSRMKFCVLAKKSKSAEACHRQKYGSHHFKPKLVCYAPERPEYRPNRPSGSADGAIPPCLFAGHSRDYADFLPAGNFVHALDFSSLRRYNDRTAIAGRTVNGATASKSSGR